MARTGRRPGNPDTREAILAAAREAFADRGFDGASIRAIATAAGVDPALVHHYFGTKDQLFLESMRIPVDPGSVLTEVLSGGRDGVGERVVRVLLTVWDSPVGIGTAAILRSAMSNEIFSRMFREFLTHMVLRRVAKVLELDPAEAELRTGLVATQMAGLIVSRYLLRIEPVASAPVETLVAQIGPTVQRYLTEPLSPPAVALRKNQPRERP